MKLELWPLPHIRVSCEKCGRLGVLNKDKLLDRFGPDRDMWTVRQKLTEGTCERPDKKQPCMSILPDALLVQAILAETKEDIIDVSMIEEATNWDPKWLEKP